MHSNIDGYNKHVLYYKSNLYSKATDGMEKYVSLYLKFFLVYHKKYTHVFIFHMMAFSYRWLLVQDF